MFKKIISYLLSFILVVVALADILLIVLSSTVLNKNHILFTLSKNAYYSQIYYDITETFKDNTIQSGLSEEVLNGIITKEQVKEDVDYVISYLYEIKNEEFQINTADIENNLRKNINNQIKENNKNTTEEEQEEIDIYVNNIIKIYKDGIMYSEEYIKPIQKAIIYIKPIDDKCIIILTITVLVLIAILILINKRKIYAYLSITLIADGMMLILIKVLEATTMKIQNILIFNQAFSKVLINLIENIIILYLIVGTIMIFGGILISIKQRK